MHICLVERGLVCGCVCPGCNCKLITKNGDSGGRALPGDVMFHVQGEGGTAQPLAIISEEFQVVAQGLALVGA